MPKTVINSHASLTQSTLFSSLLMFSRVFSLHIIQQHRTLYFQSRTLYFQLVYNHYRIKTHVFINIYIRHKCNQSPEATLSSTTPLSLSEIFIIIVSSCMQLHNHTHLGGTWQCKLIASYQATDGTCFWVSYFRLVIFRASSIADLKCCRISYLAVLSIIRSWLIRVLTSGESLEIYIRYIPGNINNLYSRKHI